MSTTYRIGPAVILTSASISDPLSDWTEVHRTRGGITVSMPAPMSSRARTNDSAAPVAAWTTQGMASVGFKMVNRDITTMAALIPGATAMNVSTKDALKINTALAKLTPVAVAVVPLSEYNDDKQFLGSANAVVFEKAVFRLGDMESSVDTDTEELDGYMVDIHSVNGVVSVGYAEVGMPELNPQGLEFLWQYSIDGALSSAFLGTGEISGLATFPADGITMILQLNVAASAGEVSLGDASLSSGKYSVGISDSNNVWVRAGGVLYTQSGTAGVAETILTLAQDGTINVWDDDSQTITNAATAGLAGFTLNSASDDVVNSYTVAETDAVAIVRGILTPAQIRRILR